MTKKTKRKLNWASLTPLERLTLLSTILIWAGVVSAGAGLFVAFRNQRIAHASYAQATEVAQTAVPLMTESAAVTATATATNTLTPTATPLVFPSGWSTATPTVVPTEPTLVSTRAVISFTLITATPTPTPVASQATPVAQHVRAKVKAPPPASEPPNRIQIPSIELDAPIVPVGWQVVEHGGQPHSVWEVADNAVGWHKTSAYPGQADNLVLNGHHNIRGEVFRDLIDIQLGDRATIYAGEQAYYYVVAEKYILKEKGEPLQVRQQNAQWIAATDDERLTMVTCWPYSDNTHRLVVVARPAPPLDAYPFEP